jgi:hypothetical protein
MLLRVMGALTGAILAFALWIVAVLTQMPKPPVPPSFALTLTAPVATAVGFAAGAWAVEHLRPQLSGDVRATFLWTFGAGELGAVVMYPFGGMMAGFGIVGFGLAALIVREWPAAWTI